MTINLFDAGGCPLERQRFTWNELMQNPLASSMMAHSRACASSS
jgi:hypothetical protein